MNAPLARDTRTLLVREQPAEASPDEDGEAPQVVFEVPNAKALSKVPYEQQADPSMELPKAKYLRRLNREDTRVLAMLQSFWESAIADREHRDFDEVLSDTSSAVLTRGEYLGLYGRIARGLAEEYGGKKKGKKKKKLSKEELAKIEEEANEQAESAWTQDTKGDVLEFERGALFDSIFEVCVEAPQHSALVRAATHLRPSLQRLRVSPAADPLPCCCALRGTFRSWLTFTRGALRRASTPAAYATCALQRLGPRPPVRATGAIPPATGATTTLCEERHPRRQRPSCQRRRRRRHRPSRNDGHSVPSRRHRRRRLRGRQRRRRPSLWM